MTDPFGHDLLLVEQKLAPVANLHRAIVSIRARKRIDIGDRPR